MVTITAPGVEIHEVDLSFYDFPRPREETQNVFITGFANKGYNCIPYEFTSKSTDDDLINTFGVPTNEAERYFYNACSEAIKRDKVVLYASRMPYLNTATANYRYTEYTFKPAAVKLSTVSTMDVDLRGLNSKNIDNGHLTCYNSNAYNGNLSAIKDLVALKSISDADHTLDNTYVMEIQKSEMNECSQADLEKYRTTVKKPKTNSFIIVDKNQEVYDKIPVDATHMSLSSRYMIGLLPIVTTATNAMFYQKLIADSLISTELTYKKNGGSIKGYNDSVTEAQASSIYYNGYATSVVCDSLRPYCFIKNDNVQRKYPGADCFAEKCISVDENIFMLTTENPTSRMFNISVWLSSNGYDSSLSSYKQPKVTINENFGTFTAESSDVETWRVGNEASTYIVPETYKYTLSSFIAKKTGIDANGIVTLSGGVVPKFNQDCIISAVQYGKRLESSMSCYEAVDSLSSKTIELQPQLLVYPASSQDLEEGNKDALTISKYAAGFFPTIGFNPDGSFDRDRLKNIGVVVFKGWVDAESGNKVKYEPIEAFAGSLKSDDVDSTTGKSRFIDDIVNTNSKTIEFYSNCFNSKIKGTWDIDKYVSLTDQTANTPKNPETKPIDILFKTTNPNSKNSKANNLSGDMVFAATGADTDVGTLTSSSDDEVLTAMIDYSDIGLLHVNNIKTYAIGFEETDAKDKTISYELIMSSLDKMFEKSKDINKMQIDMVVDAGMANIAQFMYTVNGNKDVTAKEVGPNKSVWLSCYDPIAYQDDDSSTPTVNETRSAVDLWDICTRVGDGSASVEKDGATDKWALVLKKYDAFCKKRSDCFFIADGLRPFCVCGNHKRVRANDFNTTVNKTLNPFIKWMSGKIDTSYGCGYCDWYQIVDPTSGVNMWMPPSIKAMCVNLDTTNQHFYWTVPAGINYGKLNPVDNPSKVIVKDIAFSPTTEEAGNIYTKSWNYCTYYWDEGFVLEGQRTFQTRPTAFDRINVRKLFLYLERKTFLAARYFIYQGNTAYTRQKLVDTITPYFEYAKVNGGLYDYRIQCDEKNNTPDTIDRNELHVKVAIKPTKAIEFIEVTFYALRTGGSFTEAGMQD